MYILDENYVLGNRELLMIGTRLKSFRLNNLDLSLTPTSKEYVTIVDTIALVVVSEVILKVEKLQEKTLFNIAEQIISLINEEFVFNKDILLSRATRILNSKLEILTQSASPIIPCLLGANDNLLTFDMSEVKNVVVDTVRKF